MSLMPPRTPRAYVWRSCVRENVITDSRDKRNNGRSICRTDTCEWVGRTSRREGNKNKDTRKRQEQKSLNTKTVVLCANLNAQRSRVKRITLAQARAFASARVALFFVTNSDSPLLVSVGRNTRPPYAILGFKYSWRQSVCQCWSVPVVPNCFRSCVPLLVVCFFFANILEIDYTSVYSMVILHGSNEKKFLLVGKEEKCTLIFVKQVRKCSFEKL